MDKRFKLKYVFEKGIKNKIIVNQELKKPDQRLPDKLLKAL